jgi:PST family polysaccharide transporter/lipopolysaccharide exporter
MAAGMVQALADTTVPLFRAVGRPDLVTKCAAVRLVVVGAALYPFTLWWGLIGPGWALLGSGLAIGLVELWLATRLIRVPVPTLLSAVAYPVGHSALMALVVLAAQQALGGVAHNFVEVFQLVTVGVISYVAFVAISVRWAGYEGVQDLLAVWNEWLAKRTGPGSLAAP